MTPICGRWKLMATGGKPVELFDLHTDPQENVDLLGQHGDLAEQLAGCGFARLRHVLGVAGTLPRG